MNHIYRVVFNSRLGLWQAVCEIARASGGGSAVVNAGGALALSLLLTAVLSPGMAHAGGDGGYGGAYADSNWQGGSWSAGTLGGDGGHGGEGYSTDGGQLGGAGGSGSTGTVGAAGASGLQTYGGGGGGATGSNSVTSVSSGTSILGGAGGVGGEPDFLVINGAKAGGGGGGAGIVRLSGNLAVMGTVTGGAGGGSQLTPNAAGSVWSGGGGGAGIVANDTLVTIFGSGVVTGGAGGASTLSTSIYVGRGGSGEGGALGATRYNTGAQGGAGIVGSNLNLTVAGTVTGGAGGTSQPQAAAIRFNGGSSNLLTLQQGHALSGGIVLDTNVQATVRNDGPGTTQVLDSAIAVGSGGTVTLSGQNTKLDSSGVIYGAGNLAVEGPSLVSLLATSTYTGSTTLNANSLLQLGNGGTTGSIDSTSGIALGLNSKLVVNRSDTLSLSMPVTGSGILQQAGSGSTTLNNGGNKYSGGTQVTGGTLIAAASNALGTGAVSVTGTLSTVSTSASTSTLQVNSDVTLNTGNAITLGNNGTLDNRGVIKSLVSSNASAGAITVSNTGTTSQPASIDGGNAGAVSLGNGGTVMNMGNAFIGGTATPAGVTIQGGVGTVNNSQGATIRGSTTAVALGTAGSQLNNSDGALITGLSGNGVTLGADAGVNNLRGGVIVGTSVGIALTSGGTVLNDGWGSSPGGSRVASTISGGAGGVLASNAAATVNNKNGAVIGGGLGAGVQLLQGGSVVNDGVDTQSGTASRISGGFAGVSIEGAAGTVTNSNGASIEGGFLSHGVSLNSGGNVTNSGNATITGGLVGVNLAKGGSVTNEAGSTITGTLASVQATSEGGATLLTNHGKLNGSVTLDDQAANQVTLGTGSNITGDLNMGAQVTSSLTLTGAAVGGASPLYSTAVTGTTTFAGALTKNGSSTWVLDRDLSAAKTMIDGGTLQLGNGQAVGSVGSGDIINNSTLLINRSDTLALGQVISGMGSLQQGGTGTTLLTGTNTYTGGTVVASGTLQAGSVGALVQNTSYYLNQGATLDLNNHALQASMLMGNGNVLLGSADLTVSNAAGQTDSFGGQIAGTGHLVKQGAGTLTLNGASTFSGGVNLKQGRINLGNALGLGTGILSMDDGTTIGLNANGMTIANNLLMTGHNDPIIDTGANNATWAGAISGAGFLTKQGTGTLTLTSTANNYTGATDVAQGALQAGAANAFSTTSAHNVASGAMLDLAGYSQTLASLNNSGMVKLSSNGGGTPGAVLKVTGPYVGLGGTLGIATVLAADGSATDKLLLSGATAVAGGTTTIQITNAGGLGAQTTGAGIQVVGTENGGSLQANSFTLAGGHVDAGAYEYRLFQTAQGATLQSTNTQLAYRSEVPLMSALPALLRQADMAMLGDVHKRMGDDNVQSHNGIGNASASTDLGQNRRAWGRILRTDPTIHQQGTVSPESSGHMTGFQAGLDLYANHRIKVGIYVGQLDGDMRTTGFAGGIHSKSVGFNTLRSRYLGVYGNWKDASGLYADAVLQGADYRSQLHTAENTGTTAATTKGSGWLASLEVGKSWALKSHWLIEPQAQLIYRKISLDDTALSMATVKNRADDDWTLRLGARIKGSFTTSAGVLQPYGRINVYKASSTTDVASFVVPAATTDVKAKGGYTATELAAGASLQLRKSTSLYGELGKLWANGGDNRVKSGVQASVGLKVLW